MFTLKNNTRGFTLIELLVVITIIGILATGGTAVFTTQIQKARDSTRQSDMAQYATATEQYLSDNTTYPAVAGYTWSVAKYMSKLTKDPRNGDATCKTNVGTLISCGYYYNVSANSDGLTQMVYKLWATLENQWNINKFASGTADGGTATNSNYLFEIFAGGWSGAVLNATGGTIVTN
jgi:prepilin-type N-terminal cleavage/methylation domain-containing protein